MNNIDTLVIIGNGFDIWQKLDTSYFRFKEFLLSHIDNIMDELQIDKRGTAASILQWRGCVGCIET